MTLVDQPVRYTNMLIRVSPDGRFAAFLSSLEDVTEIIVHDRQAGTWTSVPPPDENVFKPRNVKHMEWGDDGHSLYVVEDATVGIRDRARWRDLTDGELRREAGLHYYVLHSWRPGDAAPKVIDRSRDRISTLATDGNRLRIVVYLPHKEAVADLREYRDGRLASSRLIRIRCDDQNIEGYACVRLLASRNELWFSTQVSSPNPLTGGKQSWIAVLNLDAPDPVARLVVPNACTPIWTPDERRMVCYRYEESDPDQGSLCMVPHDALDAPEVFESFRTGHGTVSPQMVGIDLDGRTMYFNALVPEKVDSSDELHVAGNRQIYQYRLPEDATLGAESSLLTGAPRP